MPPFETFEVSPELPTSLSGYTSVPLPASDTSFYPAVNSYTVPQPLNKDRLRSALAQTLQLFPLHCGEITINEISKQPSITLANRPVRLVVGTTSHAGPFSQSWRGETHPDYYEELERGDMASVRGKPLCQVKVTTWDLTGQTAIFISQSYVLGDAFAITHFARTWSSLYQGKEPPPHPTFEKYFLPKPRIEPRASLAADIAPISFMAADVDNDFFLRKEQHTREKTLRLDIDFPGCFVDRILAVVKEELGSTNRRVSLGDSFSGYLIFALQSCLEQPVETLHQLVAMRGRTISYNGHAVTLTATSQGNAYMICATQFPTPLDRQTPGSLAETLYKARRALADSNRLGRVYMLYNSFYEKAIYQNKIFMDAGYKDAIAINWLANPLLNGIDFGFPLQSGHIEWESLENFIQVMPANPTKQGDGGYRRDPKGLHITVRLQPNHAKNFLERLYTDMDNLSIPQDYASSPAAALARLRGPSLNAARL